MRARRGRGEGSIRERRDGLWEVRLSARENGIPKQKSTYHRTKADALAALRGELSDRAFRRPGSDQLLGPYLDNWIETTVTRTRRPKTLELYSGLVEHHIGDLRKQPLYALTPRMIEEHLRELDVAGISSRNRQLVRTVLKVALKDAVPDLLSRNPVDGVKQPRDTPREIHTLAPREAARFMKAASRHRDGAIFILALSSGLRLGELLALRREDLYLKEGFLTVRFQYVDANGKRSLEPVKTKRARRRVDLPQEAVLALQRHLRTHKRDFVFSSSTGVPITRKRAREAFSDILKAAKLPRIRPHDTRHTQASLMLVAGVHPQIVSERLGHASVGFTLATYSHSLPTLQREAVDRVGRLLYPGNRVADRARKRRRGKKKPAKP